MAILPIAFSHRLFLSFNMASYVFIEPKTSLTWFPNIGCRRGTSVSKTLGSKMSKTLGSRTLGSKVLSGSGLWFRNRLPIVFNGGSLMRAARLWYGALSEVPYRLEDRALDMALFEPIPLGAYEYCKTCVKDSFVPDSRMIQTMLGDSFSC